MLGCGWQIGPKPELKMLWRQHHQTALLIPRSVKPAHHWMSIGVDREHRE